LVNQIKFCDSGCQTITAMTRKLNINVHVVSHVKEKIVHVDTQTQAESQKLADIDEEIAKVRACKLVFVTLPPTKGALWRVSM